MVSVVAGDDRVHDFHRESMDEPVPRDSAVVPVAVQDYWPDSTGAQRDEWEDRSFGVRPGNAGRPPCTAFLPCQGFAVPCLEDPLSPQPQPHDQYHSQFQFQFQFQSQPQPLAQLAGRILDLLGLDLGLGMCFRSSNWMSLNLYRLED